MSMTLLLLIATVAVSLWAFQNPNIFQALKHSPIAEKRNGEYYRLVTSAFLHGDFIHLFLNMFVLYEFGRYVEEYFIWQISPGFGKLIFLIVYLLMGIVGDLSTFLKHGENPYFS